MLQPLLLNLYYLWELSRCDAATIEALSFLLFSGHLRCLPLLDIVLGGGVRGRVCQERDDCAVMDTLHQMLPLKRNHLEIRQKT